jgi:SAM-dependent methyltransferase
VSGTMTDRIVSTRTLAHYDRTADAFWSGTRDHDVTQNYAALLDHLPGTGARSILDLGCGPGRDLLYFRTQGHEAVGLEGCPSFVAMARSHSGCEVWQQDFLALSLPRGRFHGVFANASLFHVPSSEIERVLSELYDTLVPAGVLFAVNPRGQDEEGWQGDRYGVWYREETWNALGRAAGFEEVLDYYRPTGNSRADQPWYATVWRRP